MEFFSAVNIFYGLRRPLQAEGLNFNIRGNLMMVYVDSWYLVLGSTPYNIRYQKSYVRHYSKNDPGG